MLDELLSSAGIKTGYSIGHDYKKNYLAWKSLAKKSDLSLDELAFKLEDLVPFRGQEALYALTRNDELEYHHNLMYENPITNSYLVYSLMYGGSRIKLAQKVKIEGGKPLFSAEQLFKELSISPPLRVRLGIDNVKKKGREYVFKISRGDSSAMKFFDILDTYFPSYVYDSDTLEVTL